MPEPRPNSAQRATGDTRKALKRTLGLLGAVWWMSAVSAAHAQATDRPQSPACQQALAALQAREAQLAEDAKDAQARPPKPDAAWQNLRRRAAKVCLGGSGDMPASTRTLQAPITITPAGRTSSPAAAAPAGTTAGSALPAVKAPLSVTGCDALGCWTNDGRRLNRVGSQLQGPNGLCTVQGTSLHCP